MSAPDRGSPLPVSPALAEASSAGSSLSEAVARFDAAVLGGTHDSPEARAALRKIIEENQKMRERWEAAERSGAKPPRAEKVGVAQRTSAAAMKDLI